MNPGFARVPGVSLRAILILAILATMVPAAPCQLLTAQENVYLGCLDRKPGVLVLDSGTVLKGNTAGLQSDAGDELRLTGEMSSANLGSRKQQVLTISSYKVLFKIDPSGVRPRLGDPRGLVSIRNAKYGISMRLPKGWPASSKEITEQGKDWATINWPEGPDFVNQNGVVRVLTAEVPQQTYPQSNFYGGKLDVFVDPAIDTPGTCRQFAMTDATFGATDSANSAKPARTVNGIRYAQTSGVSVGGPLYVGEFHLHTFQNGYCYEFAVEFNENTGMGLDLSCTMQWLTSANETDLLTALLSRVSFARPEVSNAVRRPADPPRVTVLRESPLNPSGAPFSPPGSMFAISWTTRGADYVEVRYPCTGRLALYGVGTSVDDSMMSNPMNCGPVPGEAYPPNRSGVIEVNNRNRGTEAVALTVVPFRNGKAYPEGAKTITVSVAPHQP